MSDDCDTEPPPPKEKVCDREALVSIALEAIVCDDQDSKLADDIIDLLRDMGRSDIIEEAEELLMVDEDEDVARMHPIDSTELDS